MKFKISKMDHPNGGHMWMIFTHEGMLVGSVAGNGAKFGETPETSIMRAFDSDKNALEWLKCQCRNVYGRNIVNGIGFEEVDETKNIIPATMDQLSRVRH